jgi:hypothetical protein
MYTGVVCARWPHSSTLNLVWLAVAAIHAYACWRWQGSNTQHVADKSGENRWVQIGAVLHQDHCKPGGSEWNAQGNAQWGIGVVLWCTHLARRGAGGRRLGIRPLNFWAGSIESPFLLIFSTLPVTLLSLPSAVRSCCRANNSLLHASVREQAGSTFAAFGAPASDGGSRGSMCG